LKQEWQKSRARDQANRQQKLGLVWRNRKKISQIIEDYFYLPFFLLIILWGQVTSRPVSESVSQREKLHAYKAPVIFLDYFASCNFINVVYKKA
jgi:hypothetical protein